MISRFCWQGYIAAGEKHAGAIKLNEQVMRTLGKPASLVILTRLKAIEPELWILLTVMALSFNKASAMIRIKESSLSLSDVEKGNESYRISKVQDKPTFS